MPRYGQHSVTLHGCTSATSRGLVTAAQPTHDGVPTSPDDDVDQVAESAEPK